MRKPGHTGAPRLRSRAALVAAALGLSTGVPLAGAAGAAAAATPPSLRHVTVSHSHVSAHGGNVKLRAEVSGANRCRLTVHPTVHQLPKAKSCSGSHVSWKVRLPGNHTTRAVHYHFGLHAAASQGHDAVVHQVVTESPTHAAPALAHLVANPAFVHSRGGPIKVKVHTTATKSCSLTVTPALPGYPRTAKCHHSTKSWTVHLPANYGPSPAPYQIAVTATGTRGRTVSATTGAVVSAPAPTCPGETTTAKPTTTAVFNDPTTQSATGEDAVVAAMINLICHAQAPGPDGPTEIDLAAFTYQLDDVTQALLWAHQYDDATVRLVLDGANAYITAPNGKVSPNPAFDALVAGLPTGSVLLCGSRAGEAPPPPTTGDDEGSGRPFPSETACAGNNIMHAKMLLVSAVDAKRQPAVFTTSQNLSTTAEASAFNNGLQVVGNGDVYNDDLAYFRQLRTDKEQPDLGDALTSADAGGPDGSTLRTYYYPRNSPAQFPAKAKYDQANDASTDAVADLLDQVDCLDPGDIAGDQSGTESKTTVQLAIFDFAGRKLIRNQLEDLADQGCEVTVIYAEMSYAVMSGLVGHPNMHLMQVDDAAYPFSSGDVGSIFVHDKYLLISGGLQSSSGTEQNQNLVLTGSQNFTEHGLHFNDEATVSWQQTMTSGSSDTIFSQYENNWAELAQVAANAAPQT